MIIDLPNNQSAVYQLVESLRVPGSRFGVRRATLDDPDQDETLLQKLGARGWGRLNYFRNHFETGWGENQQGQSLSPRAFEAFLRFVKLVDFPPSKKRPSVFLTDAGGIELCWEDSAGLSLQVEFAREKAEYYIASKKEEGILDYSEITRLASLLSF